VAKILLIDDDQLLTDIVSVFLRKRNHDVEIAFDGQSGQAKLNKDIYHLAIIDWKLPLKSGIDICLDVRKQGLTLPILMFTSRGQQADIVRGLDVGADDYVTKPFELEELNARVSALLRRPEKVTLNEIICGDIALTLGSTTILRSGVAIQLSPIEYTLLEFLMRNQGKIFTAEELLDRVWTNESEGSYAAVATCIKRLRIKLSVPGGKSIIKTVHGSGYKIEM